MFVTEERPERTPLERASDGMTPREAAAELGVAYQTVLNWIRAGHLPVTRFGAGPRARIRIHPDDLAQMRQ